MSRLRLCIPLLLLALSTTAHAQRGGGGASGRMGGAKSVDWNGMDSDAPRGPSLAGRDLERLSPLAYLVDKKKDLKLTDAQLAALKEADAKLRADNAAQYQAVDSLRIALRVRPGATLTAEEEAGVVIGRESMSAVVGSIRTAYAEAVKAATAGWDESQRTTATELLAKHAESFGKTVMEKMGGGRGMGGPGRRGGV